MEDFPIEETDPLLRHKVVRSGFWWTIRIGTGTMDCGRFFTRIGALRVAELLRSEFMTGEYLARLREKPKQQICEEHY